MENGTHISRRAFLGTSTAVAVSTWLSPVWAGEHTSVVKSRIVRIYNPKATRTWDYNANKPWNHTVEPGEGGGTEKTKERYYDYINEDVVAGMLGRGLRELTDSSSAAQAWRKLLPGFSTNHTFAIKMNMNNASFDEKITTNRMDQTMPLVNVVLDGLVNELGVPEQQITLLDASRWFHPVIMKGRCKFVKVKWADHKGNPWDESESVTFTKDKPGLNKRKQSGNFWMPKAYTQSDHILNLCLMKRHGCGITGAMKNHFGSIPSPNCLHEKWETEATLRTCATLPVSGTRYGSIFQTLCLPTGTTTSGRRGPGRRFRRSLLILCCWGLTQWRWIR